MSKRRETRIDRRPVRAWMVLNSIRAVDIQRALGLRYGTQVIETLSGVRDDKRVLAWLKDNGCPEKDLKLPPEMLEAA